MSEKTYTQNELESILKDRISKVAKRANEAEERTKQLQTQLEDQKKSLGTVDLLTQQIEELKGQLSTSQRKYQRHSTISRYGFTDPDLIEAFEWSFDKSQSNIPKKDRVDIGSWLSQHLENPDQAPIMLRPHLKNLTSKNSQPPNRPTNQESQKNRPSQPVNSYPNVNAGALPAPEAVDILKRAASDPDFYSANRDKIKQIWKNRKRNGINGR